jgi:tetratricopeptide (TPR) repeat protein
VYERAIAVGREQGMRGDVQYWLRWQLATKRYGPTPAADVIAAADALIEESRASGAPFATAQCYIAVMHAMSGEIAAARELLATARPRAERHGLRGLLILAMEEAVVLGLAGDHEAAIRSCRETYELAGRHGETGQRPGVGSHLAEQLALARRYADAEAMATETAAVASPDDLPTQARLRWVQARVAADRADLDGAERLAREAVDIADATDLINHRGDAHRALAEVLAAAGRDGEAAAEWRTALEHYARKGNLVRAAQVRGQLLGVNAA